MSSVRCEELQTRLSLYFSGSYSDRLIEISTISVFPCKIEIITSASRIPKFHGLNRSFTQVCHLMLKLSYELPASLSKSELWLTVYMAGKLFESSRPPWRPIDLSTIFLGQA